MLNVVIENDGQQYNFIKDFKCYAKRYNISGATPKTHEIDVLYSDGTIDFSDVFGRIHYKNRNLTIPMKIVDKHPQEIYRIVQNMFSGKKCKIFLEPDVEFYYEGRITIGMLETQNFEWRFQFSAVVDPYQYKDHVEELTARIDTTNTYYIQSGKKIEIPAWTTITGNFSLDISVNGVVYSPYVGNALDHVKFPELVLYEGINEVAITGKSGIEYTVIMDYREGWL